MTRRFPGRRNDIGHAGAVEQACRGKGEFAIALVDCVHDGMDFVLFGVGGGEQFQLAAGCDRLERGHLDLMDGLAVPGLLYHSAA